MWSRNFFEYWGPTQSSASFHERPCTFHFEIVCIEVDARVKIQSFWKLLYIPSQLITSLCDSVHSVEIIEELDTGLMKKKRIFEKFLKENATENLKTSPKS